MHSTHVPRLILHLAHAHARAFEVVLEHHEVVILFLEVSQAVVLSEEVEVFKTRPVVSKLVRSDVFSGQHLLEKASSVAASLHRLSNVKVQDAKWLQLYGASIVMYEQLLAAVLDDSQAAVSAVLNY